MKTTKRVLSGVLALVMVLALCPVLSFAADAAGEPAEVVINIPALTNGTVTLDKESYKVGDTVKLTVNPAAGYFQKLYINGEPLMLNWKSKEYTFVAEKEHYEISGSFVREYSMSARDWGRWDNYNQGHNVLNTYYPNNDEAWWMTLNGEYQGITLGVKNYLPNADAGKFAVVVGITLDNNKTYGFRLYNDNGTYAIALWSGNDASGSPTANSWGNWNNVNYLAEKICGEGVYFKLERTSDNVITISVDGTKIFDYTMEGISASNKIASISIRHYGNQGQKVAIPFYLQNADTPKAEIVIPEFANGAVTADKTSYKVGDFVTLNIQPDAGYFQKLYINGKPIILSWKTTKYTFVATDPVMAITGSFETGAALNPSDSGRWDTSNQAHGILTTYYPNNDDSWWMEITGEYQSITIKAKNYLPKEDTIDNNGNPAGYQQILRIKIKDKYYAFRLYNDKGQYAVSATAISNSVSGWGNWKALDSTAAAAVNGEGVDFKLERVGANTLEISVNGVVLTTYTMEGVTEADKVQAVGIQQNRNRGKYVQIPFEAEPAVVKASFEIKHNLNLKDLVQIGYWIKADANVKNYQVGLLVWNETDYLAETDHTINSATAYKPDLKENGGYLQGYGEGIKAQELDTVYYAVPYIVTAKGEYVYGEVDRYAAPTYATQMEDQSDKVKQVVCDLLNYATYAQYYFASRSGVDVATLNPINSVLPEEKQVNRYDASMKKSALEGYDDITPTLDVIWHFSTANLEEAINLNFFAGYDEKITHMLYWSQKAYEAANGNLTVENATAKIAVSRRAMGNKDCSVGTLLGVYPKDMADWQYVCAYNEATGTYSQLRVESVSAYLTRVIDTYAQYEGQANTNGYLVELAKAMLAYGESAKAYAG